MCISHSYTRIHTHAPLSLSHTHTHHQARVSRGSDDEDTGVKEWLKGARSFDELSDFHDPQNPVFREKKSRTSKLISRIFKRKTLTPGSLKMKKGGSTLKMFNNRDSSVSDGSPMSGNRERCLTASISMPDITGEFLLYAGRYPPPPLFLVIYTQTSL